MIRKKPKKRLPLASGPGKLMDHEPPPTFNYDWDTLSHAAAVAPHPAGELYHSFPFCRFSGTKCPPNGNSYDVDMTLI